MAKKKTFEEEKAEFDLKQEALKNKAYSDWDSVIIQINHGEKGLANIRMMRQDIEAMAENHNSGIGDIMEMMLKALEEEHVKKSSEENAVS